MQFVRIMIWIKFIAKLDDQNKLHVYFCLEFFMKHNEILKL